MKSPLKSPGRLPTPGVPKHTAGSPIRIETDEQAIRLAKQYQKQGLHKEAKRLCLLVLNRSPKNFDALYLAGTLALDIKTNDVAAQFLSQAALVNPTHAFTHLILAETYDKLYETDAAIIHFKNVLKLKPNMVAGLCGLGRTYIRTGHADLALPLFEKAHLIDPNHKAVNVGLGEALINLGRMEEGSKYLKASIRNRHSVGWSWSTLATAKKFSGDAPELELIRQDLAAPDLTVDDKSQLHFAAGKILNDLKRYDEAMGEYNTGKKIRGHDFDVDAYRRWVDAMTGLFTAEMFRDHAGIGDPTEVPVFVVGMPRSGTTLTEQICASHPDVHGAGELYDLKYLTTKVGSSNQQLMAALTPENSARLAGLYLNGVRRHAPDALRIVDKLPLNFQLIGFIALLFPNARIIHCRRDPIDTCVSCYMTDLGMWHGYTSDLEKLGLYYREYDRLMQHWNSVLPGRIFERRYEDAIADEETETRRLIDHLGLPWNDACLKFNEQQRQVGTPSMLQVRQPVYQSSVKRWKNYGDHLKPLIRGLGDLADV